MFSVKGMCVGGIYVLEYVLFVCLELVWQVLVMYTTPYHFSLLKCKENSIT